MGLLDLLSREKDNTKLEIKTLGEVELKFISLKDRMDLSELYASEEISDREFAQRILYNQLVKPRIDFEEFKTLSDEELLKIGKSFVEDHISEQFKDTDDFFRDFRLAVKGLDEILKTITKVHAGLMSSAWKQLAIRIREWSEQSKSIYKDLDAFLSGNHTAVRILRKYKWFVTPSLQINLLSAIVSLDERKGRQDKVLNRLFIHYFSSNDWYGLEMMVKGWVDKPLFKKRMKILMDCVRMLKETQGKGINQANVVLPTLIAQIDGILSDYLESKKIQLGQYYVEKSLQGKELKKLEKFRRNKSTVLTPSLDDLANDVFLDTLFHEAYPGKPLDFYLFNRHKIAHGEIVRYGRKDYLIRAFLVLDFLAHLN